MASNPGILTDWPWKPLGNFKYLILAPWAVHSIYSFAVKEEGERDLSYLLVFPFLLTRMLHNQIWISLSRHRTAKGNNRIVDKGIGFDQVDRERNWDDQILFNGAIFYIGQMTIPHASHLPIWRTSGVIMTILLHAGPVEFLYYWLHRLLHHHFLYSRYHSHHHSSIVTEPITSVVHPFGEHIAYFMLFAIPLYTTIATGTASIVSFAGYISYIDFMNNMGHCNFELFSITWLFSIFPPLKYLMYTPSFHSLHHTQFRTNYSLFMPIYDYIYNTMDKSTDDLSENSLRREEDAPNVVHLTHLTTPQSIYHLRIGFASLASKPARRSAQTWYFWILWPITCGFAVLSHFLDRTFVLERNTFKNLNLQSWVVPRYTIQFFMERQREVINKMIGESILEADKRGVKVLSLGLLTQGEDLNENGELYVQRNPDLKVKVVDGSSLAAAVVLNTIPEGTTQVLLQGRLSKVAYAIAHGLCQRGIQVVTASRKDYEKLKPRLINTTTNNNTEHDHLIFSSSYAQKVWLVGDGLSKAEQLKAAKGTFFIPYSQFPPKKVRKDCFYHSTPAMMVPKSLENMDSCENWLARRVMSAWRAAGIVHALEGWRVNECGQAMLEVQEMWEATLKHGFLPLQIIPH